MKRLQHKATTGLLLVGWLGLAGTVCAGPAVNVMQPCDCPPNHYSAMHVLTPALWRWAAWCQGPCRYTFARVFRPEVATTTYVKRYHCPFVNPLQFAVQNYPGMNGIPPSSSYQAQSDATQESQRKPLDELPPPSAEKARPPEQLPPPKEEPAKPN